MKNHSIRVNLVNLNDREQRFIAELLAQFTDDDGAAIRTGIMNGAITIQASPNGRPFFIPQAFFKFNAKSTDKTLIQTKINNEN